MGFSEKQLLLCRRLALFEALYAPARVEDFLLSRIERVTRTADLNINLGEC